jgi:hypothetical protein
MRAIWSRSPPGAESCSAICALPDYSLGFFEIGLEINNYPDTICINQRNWPISTATLIGMVWSSICRYLHQTQGGGTADDLRLCPRIDNHLRREWTDFKYPGEHERQSFSLGRAPNRPHVHLTAVRPERQSNPQGFDREAEFSVQQTEAKIIPCRTYYKPIL